MKQTNLFTEKGVSHVTITNVEYIYVYIYGHIHAETSLNMQNQRKTIIHPHKNILTYIENILCD